MSGAFSANAAVVTGPPDKQARIRWMVDEYIDFVARTLRKAGVPPADLDDEVQRTFITVARRIDDVDLGAERSFLYQVAVNLASHSRRKLARRREVMNDRTPERVEALATPEHLTGRKQMRELLDDIVSGMDASLRTVFLLHEIEEMNLTEIAAHLQVPRGTVASRLRRAREQIREHLRAIELASDLGATPANRMEAPTFLRRDHSSPFRRALLETGIFTPPSAAMHMKTLTALGLAAL
jgi:RNA polymerase sigma-70 factor (ECF subfamily)